MNAATLPKTTLKYTRSALIRRVYIASIMLAIAGSVILSATGWQRGLSCALGGGFAVLSFRALELALAWMIESNRRSQRFRAPLIAAGKYMAFGAGLWFLTRSNEFRPGAFAAGLTAVYFGTLAAAAYGAVAERFVKRGHLSSS